MTAVIFGSIGLAVAGLPGAVLGSCLHVAFRLRHRLKKRRSLLRPVLIVLLVELRSGRSVLGALQTVGSLLSGAR